jgi:hypothetical protein
MFDISINPLFDIKPPGFDGWLSLYQEVDKSGFWIKQNEINKLIGYSRGAVCCDTVDSFILKIHDESGKLMNFIDLTLCQDYIMDLPTVGKKRKNAKRLNAFFRELKQKLFCINGMDAVKSEYETREPVEKVTYKRDSNANLNLIISEKEKRIELLTKQVDVLHCALLDAQSTIQCAIESISKGGVEC